jgi:hypothetical protein
MFIDQHLSMIDVLEILSLEVSASPSSFLRPLGVTNLFQQVAS